MSAEILLCRCPWLRYTGDLLKTFDSTVLWAPALVLIQPNLLFSSRVLVCFMLCHVPVYSVLHMFMHMTAWCNRIKFSKIYTQSELKCLLKTQHITSNYNTLNTSFILTVGSLRVHPTSLQKLFLPLAIC